MLHEQLQLLQMPWSRADKLEKYEVVTVGRSEATSSVTQEGGVGERGADHDAEPDRGEGGDASEEVLLEVVRSLETRCGAVEDAFDRVYNEIAAQTASLRVQNVNIEELQLAVDRRTEERRR